MIDIEKTFKYVFLGKRQMDGTTEATFYTEDARQFYRTWLSKEGAEYWSDRKEVIDFKWLIEHSDEKAQKGVHAFRFLPPDDAKPMRKITNSPLPLGIAGIRDL